MAIRSIRRDGDEILKKKCKPITEITPAVIGLLDDMVETLRHADALGLAAPQVGALKRIAVIEDEDKLYELINPEIKASDGNQMCNEACLSVPGLCGDIDRPFKVTISAMDRKGEQYELTVDDYLASAFCHEIDHLNGILFTDNAKALQPISENELQKRKQLKKNKENKEKEKGKGKGKRR